MKRSSTNAEKRYLHAVSELPCVLCSHLGAPDRKAEVHHIREGQGLSQRASHYLTVALCHDCHQGPQGLHGDRTLLRIGKVEELDLLAMTLAALARRGLIGPQ